ncbi:MAG TPA: trehalose-phosphatase [Kofleriaceae bacterium]|nr:trehalose-phosphatase [Kofleriaceae bacterium]
MDTTAYWQEIARHSPLALLLDMDGTLIPLAATPDEARPGADVRELLAALAAADGLRCAVVSGRPQGALADMLGDIPQLRLVAEHGMWRWDGAAWSATAAVDAATLDQLQSLLEPSVRANPGALLERKSASLCVHYRQVGGSGREAFLVSTAALLNLWLSAHEDYELLEAAQAMEVRARKVNKGSSVAWAREGEPADLLCVAIGDDVTDEDTFRALAPGDAAILVDHGRRRPTAARWRLADPDAVRGFLGALLQLRRGGDAPAGLLPQPIAARAPRPAPGARGDRAPRLLAISNRLPHLRDPAQPSGTRKQSVGGLVSALEPVLAERRGLWLGWSGKTTAESEVGEVSTDDEGSPALAWIDLPADWEERYYNGFCNRRLWPLFHSFPAHVRFRDDEWDAYTQANQAFAEAAGSLVEPDASVWVHDYHLLLVASGLRQRGHRGPIGLFLHIPFPGADVFELIPWSRDLLAGLLDFDLVGFHTPAYVDNFHDCVSRLTSARVSGGAIEHGGRVTRARAFPLGIVPASFQEPPDPAIAEEIAALVEALHPTRLVLGVDRLDYTKGIPDRLLAFERLLQLYPEWRGQVSLVQVSVPSREDVPEYAEQRQLIENAVGRINGEYGEAHWVPVRYLYRSYGRNHLAQLYRAADVGYVTPLRDGMNLVAKEFVAAQDADDPGVLLLSRFAGAAVELADAVLTNPYHPDGMARDLDRALRMEPAERRTRHQALLAAVSRTTALTWATDFMRALESVR